jgi:predicted amidohydrolase YtcJ
MRVMQRILSAFVALILAVGVRAAEQADLVLLHGQILTMDARDRVVEALAAKGGRIIALGTDQQMLALAAKDARIIDLAGRAATPGLIDTHAHVSEGGTDELYGVPLSDARSIADIEAKLGERLTQLKPGEWLYGAGWDEGKLADGRLPSAADLDKAAPVNPVWLLHTTGHYGVANSAALRLAGITAATPNPMAGTIDHDAAGQPTGLLREDAAMELVRRLIPPRSVEQLQAGILHELEVLHSEGITAVKDPFIQSAEWDAYRGLLNAGKLSERVCVLWGAGTTLASAEVALAHLQAAPHAPQSLGDGRLISCGAKIFMDGSGGARTAWSYGDWNLQWDGHDVGNRGYPLTDPETYRAMVKLFHTARYQVGTHAIGDRAIDWVVDSYAGLLHDDPVKGLRHTIIHANLPTTHALTVMQTLQRDYDAGYPEAQAEFLWWIGDNYAGNYGPERAPHVVPLKSFGDDHIKWGGGSDFPVTPVAARYGLWASVERSALQGSFGKHPFGVAESVGMHDALSSYTRWAAPLLFLEDKIGSLEIGKHADIAVWDRNPYQIPSTQIKDLTCEMTLLDGQVVYSLKRP